MAVTELTLISLGVLATLFSAGLLLNMDPETRVILGMVGALTWGLFGLSAFDVIIPATGETPEQIAVTPFIYIGFGLAMIVFVFAFLQLFALIGDKAGATEGDSLMES